MNSVNSIQWFLSTEIADFLRQTSTKDKGGKPYNLSNIAFINANLDGVDFSQMNLSQTLFFSSSVWPAPGSEDTELGVLMELEVGHGETEVYPGVQA